MRLTTLTGPGRIEREASAGRPRRARGARRGLRVVRGGGRVGAARHPRRGPPGRGQLRHLHGGRADDPLAHPLPRALLVHRDPARGGGAHVPPPVRPVLRPGRPLLALRPPRLPHPRARRVHERGDPPLALRHREGALGRTHGRGRRGRVRGRAHRGRLRLLLEPREHLHLRLAPVLLGALAPPGDVTTSLPRGEPRGSGGRLHGRLGRLPPGDADPRLELPARLRASRSRHAAAAAVALCTLVGAVGRHHGPAPDVDRGPLRARRSDRPVAGRRGVPGRRKAGRTARGAGGAHPVDRLQLHAPFHPPREGRRAGVPRAASRAAPRRGDLRARAAVRRRRPVRGLQEGRGRAHLLAALLRRLLRAVAGHALRHDRRWPALGAGALRGDSRPPRRSRGGHHARSRPAAGRRHGARRREVARHLAAHGRALRRARLVHPQPGRPALRDPGCPDAPDPAGRGHGRDPRSGMGLGVSVEVRGARQRRGRSRPGRGRRREAPLLARAGERSRRRR